MSCVKCGDVCKCISFESTDGSIIINKQGTAYGCTFDIRQNGDALYILEFDDNTRRLCIKNTQGVEIDCVTIPDDQQSLSLVGNVLSLTDGNSVTLPALPPLTINSSSIRVQQGGQDGFNVLLEVEPSADADNAIILGTDGKLFAPQSQQGNVFDDDVTFNGTVTANNTAAFKTFSATDLTATGNTFLKSTTLTDLEATGDAALNNVTVNGEFGINQGGVVVYPNVYRGDYAANTLYFLNNIVTYNGMLWVYYYTTATSGHTPADGSIYWKKFDTSTGTPGQDGKSTELRYAVNASSVTPPAIDVTQPIPAGWVLNPPALGQAEYLWMTQAQKNSDGTLVADWSTPVRMSGLIGPPGSAGTPSNMPFKSIVFKRSTPTPATPTGGSWNVPVPSGWSDGVPAGELQLWISTRIFTNDGLAPQQSTWSTPSIATDTSTLDIEWSSVVTSPGTPTTAPGNWSNTASEDDIWMATRIVTNGVAGAWQIAKIKGEDGTDGSAGPAGVEGPAGPFLSYSGNWDNTKAYYGSNDRITSVFYNGNYYVTRKDAGGSIPVGTLPTNTLYWDPIQGQYDSIATGLLLAQIAYIDNLAVSFLRTGAPQPGVAGTEHIEIYPSFATLQGFRSQGAEGYEGLTDTDLHYLANSISFYSIDDTGARDQASVEATALMRLQAPMAYSYNTFDYASSTIVSNNVTATAGLIFSDPNTLTEKTIISTEGIYNQGSQDNATNLFSVVNGGLTVSAIDPLASISPHIFTANIGGTDFVRFDVLQTGLGGTYSTSTGLQFVMGEDDITIEKNSAVEDHLYDPTVIISNLVKGSVTYTGVIKALRVNGAIEYNGSPLYNATSGSNTPAISVGETRSGTIATRTVLIDGATMNVLIVV